MRASFRPPIQSHSYFGASRRCRDANTADGSASGDRRLNCHTADSTLGHVRKALTEGSASLSGPSEQPPAASLRDLADRLRRVHAMGGCYAAVCPSEHLSRLLETVGLNKPAA